MASRDYPTKRTYSPKVEKNHNKHEIPKRTCRYCVFGDKAWN